MTPQDEPAELREQSTSGPSEAGISRRAMLFKLGLLFNGFVAAMLAVPILGTFCLRQFAKRRSATNHGSLSEDWKSFLPARLGWPPIAIRW